MDLLVNLFCVSDTNSHNVIMSRNVLLLWLLMNTVRGIKVIGGKRTATQGQNVSFPCTLTEMPATDEISQIFWKRKTGRNLVYSDLFTISPEYGSEPVDHDDTRFKFIGSLNEQNGSIQLSNVTLLDEGVYSCIFTLFPSGSYRTEIPLTVLVPPVTSLKIKVPVPVVGEDEVTYASCMAAGAKPPAEVTWDNGSSPGSPPLRGVSNSTQHANGTTTTVSHLVGTPSRDINHLLVQCVVKQRALATEDTLPFTIEVHYAPLSVNIRETSKDVLECVSDSSPKANYTWSRVNQSLPSSGISAEGDILQLVSPTSDLGGLYVCEASNRYGRKDASLYVYYATATGDRVAWWILLVFGVLAVALAVVLASWYYKRRFGVFPWRAGVLFQRPPGDENQGVEEKKRKVHEELHEEHEDERERETLSPL